MRVLVLLSTYNGERYLKEQLDSILSQVGVEVSLLIRDDGSKDGTCNIIGDYATKHQNIHVEQSENVGFIRSFSSLIRMAQLYKEEVDYFAFADQDDIWMSDKLKVACDKLAEMNPDIPNLYTSNSIQVTSEGEMISLFHPTCPTYSKGNVMIYGTEQGCSMVFNRKALEIYDQYPPVKAYHDRWMYMICAFLGTTYYDHTPRFYYRIHNGNAVGSILERDQENILMRFFSPSMFKPLNKHLEMAEEFYHRLNDRISSSDQGLLRTYIQYRKRIKCKIHLLFDQHFRCPYPDRKTRFYFFVCTLFGKV